MKRLTPNSHPMIKIVRVSLLASLVMLAGYGGVSEDTVESANKASVASVGANQTVSELSNVILSVGVSRDPDSNDCIQRFFWEC